MTWKTSSMRYPTYDKYRSLSAITYHLILDHFTSSDCNEQEKPLFTAWDEWQAMHKVRLDVGDGGPYIMAETEEAISMFLLKVL